jgi:chromosomal replication initiation ATPase DnaA
MKKEDKYKLITNIVSSYYEIPLNKLLSKDRKRKYTYPRQITMVLCLLYIENNPKKVGQEIGFYTASNVLYAKKTINGYLDVDKQFVSEFKILGYKINYKLYILNNLKI